MIPLLTSSDCEYVRASAIAWSSLQSPACQSLDDRVALALAGLAGKNKEMSLVVDCRDIVRVEDHAFDAIVDSIEGRKAASAIRQTERSLLFWLPGQLDREFEAALGHAAATYWQEGGLLSLYGGRVLDKDEALQEFDRAKLLLEENVQTWVRNCFRSWDERRRLPSTPLLANGYFDSRGILRDPGKFQWTCIALRDLVSSILPGNGGSGGEDDQEIFLTRNVGLLAVSLRASSFAAGVATLLGDYFVRTLSVIDHAGPRKRIFERTLFEKVPEGSDFILISDFIIGGSELRAAEILAEFRGGQIIGAVCLGTALRPEEYNTPCEIKSLAHLPTCVDRFICTFLNS